MMKDKESEKISMKIVNETFTRLLQDKNFKTQEEWKNFMEAMMRRSGIPCRSREDDAQLAQDMIYDAWETKRKAQRIKLAKKALYLWPDCADAYNLLAVDTANSPEEAKNYYQIGMAAGRRALGEKIFRECGGHFWGMIETRPYMRSYAGLMQCLWDEGKHDDAINHAKELLILNRNDNQGIRYILITYLATLGRYDELDKFMNKGDYNNDCMSEWLYTRALLSFVKHGIAKKSEKELAIALQRNMHVPKYLTGRKKIPRTLPDNITTGGEDEAFCYAAGNIEAWKKVPGALDWLKTRRGGTPKEKIKYSSLSIAGE